MKTKTALQIERQIRLNNRRYKAATPAQRRVMIAKDAKEQIKADIITPAQGNWVRLPYDLCERDAEHDESQQLQPALFEPGLACDCCGAGAILLGFVRLQNSCTITAADSLSGSLAWKRIADQTRWPRANMKLIEIAFEQGHGACNPRTREEAKAAEFGSLFRWDEDRLLAILDNTIANKGLFKPTQKSIQKIQCSQTAK